jgi:hypothetical protein
MPSKRKSHAQAGKVLRSFGLLPKGYKLNALTKNQKDRIRKLTRPAVYNADHSIKVAAGPFAAVVKAPKEFTSKRVSAATARKLKAGGVKVKQNIAVVQRHGAEEIHVRGNKITRVFADRKQTTIVGPESDLFKNAARFFATKKPNEYLMLRVGDRQAFGVRIHDMASFKKYITQMQRKIPDFKEFQNELYVVKVTAGEDDDEE